MIDSSRVEGIRYRVQGLGAKWGRYQDRLQKAIEVAEFEDRWLGGGRIGQQ